jgi:hypothetical protein
MYVYIVYTYNTYIQYIETKYKIKWYVYRKVRANWYAVLFHIFCIDGMFALMVCISSTYVRRKHFVSSFIIAQNK